MNKKTIDLDGCRTGYASDNFNHLLQYESEEILPIIEIVESTHLVSNSDNIDSGTQLINNQDYSFTYSGNFTIESFDQTTITVRDHDTGNDFVIKGFPPLDQRARDMYKFQLDSRDTITHEIIIQYKVSASENSIAIEDDPYFYDSELDKFVKTVEIKYLKDCINKTGEQFAQLLSGYFKQFK
jgi:hypothetical protein